MSTQNNGVSTEATTMCRASVKGIAQVIDVVSYYGAIRKIILLDYHKFEIPMFNYYWINKRHIIRIEDGFIVVNLYQGQNQYEREPFILVSQAKQVFYSRENDASN